jgi:hypothetical protein
VDRSAGDPDVSPNEFCCRNGKKRLTPAASMRSKQLLQNVRQLKKGDWSDDDDDSSEQEMPSMSGKRKRGGKSTGKTKGGEFASHEYTHYGCMYTVSSDKP